MHAPSAFVQDDPEVLAGFLRAFPFATLCRNGDAGPVIAQAPMVAATGSDGRIVALRGHLARANGFWQAPGEAEMAALFIGPEAYMSPSYYPSKQDTGRIVPTWNYLRVEVRGRVRFESDPALMRPYVEGVTRMMEGARAEPWSVDDAPADYIERLLHAIVGVHMDVTNVTGVWKLDQRKSETDRRGGMAGLLADGHEIMAEAMRKSLDG